MGRIPLALVSAYIFGSIPFAFLVTKWRTGLDIRQLGDANVGARNVIHMVGTRWGMLVGILDLAKGYVAYSVAHYLLCPRWAVLVAGFAAVVGHGFPISLRGHGGKGVAVSVGFLLGLMPRSTLLGLSLLCLVNLLLREFNISLSLAVAAIIVSSPVFGYGAWLSLYVLMLFLTLWVKKAIDLPRERVVWAQNPWPDGATPDWHPGSDRRMEYSEISRGLQTLLRHSRRHADIPLQKLHAMQDIYFQKNPDLYTPDELQQIQYYLRAVAYKFHLANLSLEQLWSLSETKRQELFQALENSLDRLDVSHDELLLLSFVFEGFLFQARSFLDFYMLYVSVFLKAGHEGSMSTERFFKALERVNRSPFAEKAERVRDYFRHRVFGTSDWTGLNPDNWGSLLQSLRDKIAHRDRLRPSFNGDETLAGEVLFNWPTLKEITYDRFCQYMQNGMFALFTDVSPVLYDLEWKSGPYRPDLWQ